MFISRSVVLRYTFDLLENPSRVRLLENPSRVRLLENPSRVRLLENPSKGAKVNRIEGEIKNSEALG